MRAGGDIQRQLALAHDFREASSGKARLIRRQLRKYNLLEMSENWNQLAFDHHVHDASTKGRKSPTHLIMDAWIKGIRFLGVVYYNEVKPEGASELLEAAAIMGIDVRIGIEVSARLRKKYVDLIWTPRGFLGRKDFLEFLAEPAVESFLASGRAVVEYETARVLALLRSFNSTHPLAINEAYGLTVQELEDAEFIESVGSGQASLVHLAEFIYQAVLPHLRTKAEELAARFESASPEEQVRFGNTIETLEGLDPETLVERYLDLTIDSAEPPPLGRRWSTQLRQRSLEAPNGARSWLTRLRDVSGSQARRGSLRAEAAQRAARRRTPRVA